MREAATKRNVSRALVGAFDEWRGWGWRRHGLALALLLPLVALRWWAPLSAPLPVNDELMYAGAFASVAEGGSPYAQGGYLYPVGPALLGGSIVHRYGEQAALLAMRGADCLGLVAAVWLALAWMPGSLARRWLLAALVITLSPAVRHAMVNGNLSPLMAGLVIGGLTLWPERPWRGGALLGVSVGVKPLAPAAIILLLLRRHRPGERAHLLAGGVAAVVAGVLLFGLPHSLELFGAVDLGRAARSASLPRLPLLLGAPQAVAWVSVVVVLIGAMVARNTITGRGRFLALATTTCLTATPLVWSHTLLLALPLQVMALVVAWERWRARRTDPTAGGVASRRHALELLLVVLGVLALQFAEGVTGIDDRATALQVLGLLPTALAPTLLTAYLWFTADPF